MLLSLNQKHSGTKLTAAATEAVTHSRTQTNPSNIEKKVTNYIHIVFPPKRAFGANIFQILQINSILLSKKLSSN